MTFLIKGALVYGPDGFSEKSVLVENGFVAAVGRQLTPSKAEVIEAEGMVLVPGFIDLHTHLRQPGFEEKETIATGTAAAAAGGFTTVCAMPNLDPVPDDLHHLDEQLQIIAQDAKIRVLPYGAITVGQEGECLADLSVLAEFVCGFSDDGRGVQSEGMMRRAMESIAEINELLRDSRLYVAAHCEDENILPENGVCVQESSNFAKQYGFDGHSNESEWAEVMRDIRLCEETGCPLHICHASTEETFEMVRVAKKKGLPVTCEVTPHNLVFCCEDIDGDDGKYKMNPPLRTRRDMEAARKALAEGVVDAIATDHAPHTAADKEKGFMGGGANGVVGLETAFAAVYTHLVREGQLSLEALVERFTLGPSGVLGELPGRVASGKPANLVLLDLETERMVNPDSFASMGKSTPFAGQMLRGWPVLTISRGEIVYRR